MVETLWSMNKKRKRIIIIIKIFIYFLVWWMYYLFFQIILWFIWLYTISYKQDVVKIKNNFILEQKKLSKLKKNINNKTKSFVPLVLELNKQTKDLKNKQTIILKHMANVLKNNIIAYWYYCDYMKNNIIDLTNPKKIVKFNDINYNQYNFIVKIRLHKKILELTKLQNTLIKWINTFYDKNCNQDTWMKTLILKYFDKTKK